MTGSNSGPESGVPQYGPVCPAHLPGLTVVGTVVVGRPGLPGFAGLTGCDGWFGAGGAPLPGTLAGKFFGDVRPGTHVTFAGAAEYVLSPEGIVSARHLFDFTGALVAAGVLKIKPV